jgi:hypothetical protein
MEIKGALVSAPLLFGPMRLMRDVAVVMTTLAAGLALAACSTAAAPHSAALDASSSAASKVAKTASPKPRPPATHATQVTVAQALPAAGNPNGHASVPRAARAVNTSHPNHVIGNGTPASCTSAAVVRAVAKGGVITFNCGPNPVTITMKATAKVVNTSHRVVLDGGNRVTLSGGGKHQILYMNTCDKKQIWTTDDCFNQQWPQLIVQNLTFEDGYSAVRQTATSFYGGGAIYAEGGQFKVVNSKFIANRCVRTGPDLGGASTSPATRSAAACAPTAAR